MLVSFLCLSLLRSSALFASGVILVSCSSGELSFSLVIYLVRGWFSWAFLVPPRSCRFRPSSGSSLLSLCCSSLQSLLPFRSRFLCCSLHILFQLGVLSLPSLAVLPNSRRLLCLSLLLDPSPSVYGLFSYVLFFGGWVDGCVVSLLFLCAPSFLHEVLLCFLS